MIEVCETIEKHMRHGDSEWTWECTTGELIRCKDCKYYKVYEMFDHTLPLCDRLKTTMAGALEEDDYCSRAERKEE